MRLSSSTIMAILFRYWYTKAYMASKIVYSIAKGFLSFSLYLKRDQLHRMAKTTDFDLCRQYLLNYIETIKTQLNTYEIELNKQKQLC